MNERQKEIFLQLTAGIHLEGCHERTENKRLSKKRSETKTNRSRKKKKLDTAAAAELQSVADHESGKSSITIAPTMAVYIAEVAVSLFDKQEASRVNVKPETKQSLLASELEKASAIRKRYGIGVSFPSTMPSPLQSFEEMEANLDALKGLTSFASAHAFQAPTPIQMQAIPAILQGRDVVGVAPTGSGKTLAFLTPILAQLRKCDESEGIHAVLISPTHELSSQTHSTFADLQRSLSPSNKTFSTLLLDKANKKKTLIKTPNVLFTTPFMLVKQLEKNALDLSQVKFLVLDEADRLFSTERGRSDNDMSDRRHYVSQLDAIVAACTSKQLVKALFSATFPPHVADLADNILVDPVRITVGRKNSATKTVDQHLLYTGSERGKLLAIRQIFSKGISPPVVIFVDTKERANQLLLELVSEEIRASCIHSDLDGRLRNKILKRFHSGQIWTLIATDLVSRGIDFVDVNMVINYDFPKSTMDYIHRIGRTGRAGKMGQSYTLFTDNDGGYVRPIANIIREAGGNVPSWMTTLKKDNWKYKKSYGSVGQDTDALQSSAQDVNAGTKSAARGKVWAKNSRKKAS